MPIEKSAGAMIFRKKGDQALFLLLSYPTSSRTKKSYWDLPKGHIEKGENEIEAAKREIEEETGLTDVRFVEEFKEVIKYFFTFDNKNILKFVTFYLAETKTEDVKISDEHLGFVWLPYEKALQRLTFKNAKDILKKSYNYISEKSL